MGMMLTDLLWSNLSSHRRTKKDVHHLVDDSFLLYLKAIQKLCVPPAVCSSFCDMVFKAFSDFRDMLLHCMKTQVKPST